MATTESKSFTFSEARIMVEEYLDACGLTCSEDDLDDTAMTLRDMLDNDEGDIDEAIKAIEDRHTDREVFTWAK